jgi:DNA-directed RNA polymerase alpha subunit/DNA-directed RNA polymerase subunit L
MNPTISEIEENGDILKFTLSDINVSLANGLRRIILSEIPLNVIHTETYNDNQCTIHINTSRLHNEILKQRLSCIPIHIKELDILPGNYVLEVDSKNDTDHTAFVTTDDFKIKNKTNSNYLTLEETRKIFPPCQKTSSPIDFARLRPKIGDMIMGEHIKLSAEFSLSTAKVNSMYNIVSKCAYGNTIDVGKVAAYWEQHEDKLRSEDLTNEEVEFQKKNYYILDAQRQFKPDSFDFVLQTLGIYENQEIVKLACDVLIGKFLNMIQLIDSDLVPINISETTMDFCYDIVLENEDYTVGKILEYILYETFYVIEKKFSFCGFKKYHPHNSDSIIRIAYKETADRNMVRQHLKMACMDAEKVYKKVKGLF